MNTLLVTVLLVAATVAQELAPPQRHDPAMAAFIHAAAFPGTNEGGREGQEALRRVLLAGNHNPALAALIRGVAAGGNRPGPNAGGHAAILAQLGAGGNTAPAGGHNAALAALNHGAGAPPAGGNHNAILATLNGAGPVLGH